MGYGGRPGVSPAVATLIAIGAIRKHDLILDVGCGTGTDCILLAQWGFRRVVGIDPNAGAIRSARKKAISHRLSRRVRFIVGRPEDLPADLARSKVDVVLHTLVGNNLEAGYNEHFRAMARALKPSGLFIACIRTFPKQRNAKPDAVAAVPGMARHFVLSRGVSSHLAERSSRSPAYAHVALWIGRPRRRPLARASERRPRTRTRCP